ncbi:MAG: PRD domain-containing protein [Clostridia bacterium]|nr:PRD domain-containing protein [Clostridia bacterium]
MENLTERQAHILHEIARSDGFVTFHDLAGRLAVSSRTVIRELSECSTWLDSLGIRLERKAGQGIRLLGGLTAQNLLNDGLDGDAVSIDFSTPDRLLFIRQRLLRDSEPVKLFTLSRQMKVAESTVSGDLVRLDDWFARFGLELVRKPGLGIYLDGSEESRRQAIFDLLHEVWNENSLIEVMLHQHETAAGKRLRLLLQFTDVDLDHLRNLIQIVEVWEKQNQLVHRERSFLSLVLQLVLLTWRENQPVGFDIHATRDTLGAMALANNLLEEVTLTLGLPWMGREVQTVARVLPVLYPELTAESAEHEQRPQIDSLDLARQMIALIQQETGYAIPDETILVDALATHLQLAITRLVFHQTIHNPLEKEIRDHYPQWFELARKCSRLIESTLAYPVPDAETAYLTLYLGAAMEKAAARSERRYHIAVLCPIGMSSSVLLASRVEAIFPQVKVDAIISFKQAPEIILQQRFDLILSTADISLPGIPILTVRPFFPGPDQDKLRACLKTLLPRKVTDSALESHDLLSQLSQANDLVSGLTSLLQNFFFITADCSSLPDACLEAAAQILPEDTRPLVDALDRRESFGHVVIADQQMALLHARTDTVKDLHFGLIRLKKPLPIDEQIVTTLLVMVAPLEIAPVKLDIMRLLSRSIIDDDTFAHSLREDDAATLYHQLERLLKNHFPITPIVSGTLD